MIITFTANPSLDRTASLPGPLQPGSLNRLGGVSTFAAGKGVNVSAAVNAAGHPTLAIVPVDNEDPLAEALRVRGVPSLVVPVGHRARTNLTITHPDGTATKLNEPGEAMTPENVSALVSALMASVPGASWLAMCGSLPPGAPVDWYVRLLETAHLVNARVAIDAHGVALDAVIAALPGTAPDLIAPNAAEMGQATGIDVRVAVAAGDIGPAVEAALYLVARGMPRVLATLGPLGAVLATTEGVWHARAEPVRVVSTVGAGDAALAGYLLASVAGADEPRCAARAVAYGTACVLLPGSQVPTPSQADAVAVEVRPLT